jgi:pyruvate formate lyase activating enzyme
VHIKAVAPSSLIEYPDHIADVVYVGACNFRCPYCYNVELVLRPEQLPDLDSSQVLRRLADRAGFVDGVVVTGGEPTLQSGLVVFMQEAKRLGFAVKLDTNGSRPDVLERCLAEQVVDYVAMDVKSSLQKYEQVSGVPAEPAQLLASIRLILSAPIEHEFRTTIVPSLVELEDVEAVLHLISGARRYFLQCFRPGRTLNWTCEDAKPAPPPELVRRMADLAALHIPEVGIRNFPQGGQLDACPS